MRFIIRVSLVVAGLAVLIVFAAAADFVRVGDKQFVVKSPPFTGKNAKVAERNNTITLMEPTVKLQSFGGKGRGKSGVRATTVYTDKAYELTPDVVVRWQKLPELKDAAGKTIKRTSEEIRKLKGKSGLPGYEAELKDLAANQIVTVRLVRARGSKGVEAERLFISRIIINGELPSPPLSDNAKKKKKKE